jgi:bifunctional non-homologous end joining protein LigD
MTLASYRKKRDFEVTPEPAGKQVKSRGRLRYVIQKHAASRLHYDFRLELGGVLLSWAVPRGPSINPSDRRLAVHVEDHPLEYGSFEGTIPAGEYGGGSVIVWDRGRWIPESSDPAADYEKGHLKFQLDGEKLHGGFSLVRMHGRRAGGKADNWLLLKQRDEYTSKDGEAPLRDRPESVISGNTIETIADARSTKKRSSKASTATTSKPTPATARRTTRKTAPATTRNATSKSSPAAARKTASKAAPATTHKITSKAAARKTTSKAAPATAHRIASKAAARKTTSKAAPATAHRIASKSAARKTTSKTKASTTTAPRIAARRKTTARGSRSAPAPEDEPTPRPTRAGADSPHTGKLPAIITPELATLVESVPAGPEWLHEVKYDGYRLIARIDGNDIRLWTRRGEDWSGRFPWLVSALRAQISAPTAILDGELVHLAADGVTRFAELQRALSEGEHEALVYFVFDLLHLEDRDLRPLPLDQRKQVLARIIVLPNETRHARVRLCEHILGQGEPLFTRACHLGLEGVISKRVASPYRSGRFRDWLKVKCGQRQEVVIGAFNPARSGGRDIGALLLGVHNDVGELVYCGKVGTGFDFAGATVLRARLDRLTTTHNPFTRRPPALARTIFVRPELVAEVSFTNWTRDGRMRHPVFQGLREDRRPADVHRERPVPLVEPDAPATRHDLTMKTARPGSPPLDTTLSHPDRVLFPADGITKLELAEYYAAVAPFMLPWVAGRPLSIVRCPDNIDKPCFFQKHIHGELPPGVHAADLDGDDGDAPYLYIEDTRGLVGLTHVGTIELHVWGSTVARPDAPDRMVIDLDPDDGVPWDRVKATAQAVRARLADVELVGFLKTTGGKGLHVVVPLTPGKQTWDEVKACARGLAREFVRAAPTLFTATSTRASRAGKIYIDYLRNYRGSTSVAPFSVRARPGAPVSVPLAWDELAGLQSSRVFTLKNLAERLTDRSNNVQGPWLAMATTRQSLNTRVLREFTAKRR